jgi:hypothetical protein
MVMWGRHPWTRSSSDLSADGVSGLVMIRRRRLCSCPSLQRVLPLRTWFMWSFIITPNDDGNDDES